MSADSTNGAQILDRGYRKFEGRRAGVRGSVRSLAWHTTRSILGLGRPARHKIFPIVVIVVAFVPSLAFLAISILIRDLGDGIRPEYWEFFGFSITAAVLFSALVSPEAVVRDRRDGMYSLYLSTPLTRPTYLLAKVIAVLGTLSIIVVGPAMFALLGYTAQGLGPDGFPSWLGVAARIVIGGFAIGAVYAAVSMAASSLTDRRAFASVAVILAMIGTSIAVGIMVGAAELSQYLRLLDPLGTPLEVAARLFGSRSTEYEDVATPLVVAANLAWIGTAAGVVVARYHKLEAV
jgi:ABC-2 type transport system permease protein